MAPDRTPTARTRGAFAAAALGVALLLSPSLASAQRGLQAPEGALAPGVAPAELQRLFDAYVVMQAQQQLQLTDDQFPRFLGRMKVLQEVRRRTQNERGQALQELRRLTQPGGPRVEDGALQERLKALDDLEVRSVEQVRQAIAGINVILDTRQQVRFRLLEEQMERRKIELLLRARQARRQDR
jgi:hypothetical protein